jgi:cyclase
MLDLVERAATELEIPFTVGGGIATRDDARGLLRAGADKVAVNKAAVDDPRLLTELAGEFGAQAVVCAIDARAGEVVTHGGREPRGRVCDRVGRGGCRPRPQGEILLPQSSTATAPVPATTSSSRARSPRGDGAVIAIGRSRGDQTSRRGVRGGGRRRRSSPSIVPERPGAVGELGSVS